MPVFRIALVLTLLLATAYCQLYPVVRTTEQVRFRIDVAIETPDGVKTGHGVWGYRLKPLYRHVFFTNREWRWERWIDGQAIAVPLGDGRVIYTLLGGSVPRDGVGAGAAFTTSFMKSFPVWQLWRIDRRNSRDAERGWPSAKAEIDLVGERRGRTFQLECFLYRNRNSAGDCPAFALVARRDGPPDARLLDINDLSDTLGPGYRLRHVNLTVTDAPVTHDPASLPIWAQAEPRERVRRGGWRDNSEEMLKTGFVRRD